MPSDDTVELIGPSLEIAEDIRDALSESYELHKTYLPWAVPIPAIEEVCSNMQKALKNFETHETEYRFFIRRLADRRIVGCVGLHIRDIANGHYEIGYWVRGSEQGKGYISRGVRLIENYAVEEARATLIRIVTAESNMASRKVAERTGYQLEKVVESNRKLSTGDMDRTYVYCKTYT